MSRKTKMQAWLDEPVSLGSSASLVVATCVAAAVVFLSMGMLLSLVAG